MSQNLMIDPITKDYIVNHGSPVASERIHEDVYYALMIPAGQWLHGVPGQGSELYRLQGTRRTANTERMFQSYAREAIETQVIATGRARDVQIYNLESSRSGTSNQISVEPQVTNVSSILNFVPV